MTTGYLLGTRWRAAILAALVAAVSAGCVSAPGGQDATPRRVLVVTGEDYPGHLWRETAPLLAAQLGADSRLAVETVTDLAVLTSPRVHEHDTVVMHFKNYDPQVPGRAGYENLARFVENGGGLVLVHFACGAFQEFKEDFVHLAGRVWDPALRGHDPHGRFTVEIVDREHPVTRGLDDFETTDELYTCLAGAVPIRVLAHSRSQVDGELYPIAFTLAFGAGRVFHTTLGHDVAALREPAAAELLRRGTAWAAGLPAEEPKESQP